MLVDLDRDLDAGAIASVRQTDLVLVIADGRAEPPSRNHPLRALLDAVGSHQRSALVLLQPNHVQRPHGTSRWLGIRPFDSHHHVRSGTEDIARVGRHLLGTSVGLVLGGGGAKAFGHIGAYRALREADVPVDRVGGSSVGAVIAAQVAAGWSPEEMHDINRREWQAARIHRRFTVPTVSMLSVRKAIAMFDRMFADADLEDLWLPCFATTVNLDTCMLEAHRTGNVARWVRASASPPGLWPPVSAPDGSQHIDGGVLDNLPVDTMVRSGDGPIVTVNVSPYQPMTARPNIVRILYRTAVVTSLAAQGGARARSDVYIEPDLVRFGLTDYAAIDEIVSIGYRSARDRLGRHAGQVRQLPNL